MKPVQYFSDEYLQRCRELKPGEVLEFLESFRLLQMPPEKSKLISIKVPESLLAAFRRKCEICDVKYQTRIKQLMKAWLEG